MNKNRKRPQAQKPSRHVSPGRERFKSEFRAPKYDRSKDGRWSQ